MNVVTRPSLRSSLYAVGVFAMTALQALKQPLAPPPSFSEVDGRIYDSIAARPLAAATVVFVSDDSAGSKSASATTDSAGRFALRDLPEGRYVVGFFHASFDTLGLEFPSQIVSLKPGRQTIELSTPSPRTIASRLCQAQPAVARGVVTGHVYSASRSEPLVGAPVAAEWMEVVPKRPLAPVRHSVTAITLQTGWFAICGTPIDQSVNLLASFGADSSGVIEVMTGPGFQHVTMMVGAATRELITAGPGQSVAAGNAPPAGPAPAFPLP